MSPGARTWRPPMALAGGVLALHLLALQALEIRSGADAAPGTARTAAPFRIRALETPHPEAPVPSSDPARGPIAAAPSRATALTSPAKGATAASHAGASPAHGDAHALPARVAPSLALGYTVVGQTRGMAVAGRAQLHWRHDGHRYEARLELEGEGLARRSQHSAGAITPGGLAPERYSERARSEEAVHFLHQAGRIVFSANRPEAALLAGAQDRLSVLLQLGAMIAARPQAYPVGASLAVQTATSRDAEVWRFRVEGTEELKLPDGPQTTLRLVRASTREFEPRIELWLALALDYAPVRLRLTQSTGDWLEYLGAGADRR